MSKEEEEAEGIIEMFRPFTVSLALANEENRVKSINIKCAITHVDGIIDEINEMNWEFSSGIAAERLDYWREVLMILINK